MYELIRVRDRGWALPRHRWAFGQKPRGEVSIDEIFDPDMQRHSKVARLLAPAGAPSIDVPQLYDVTLLRMTRGLIVLAGFERLVDESGQRAYDYAQTWLLYEVPAEMPNA